MGLLRASRLPINELESLTDVFCTDLVRVEVVHDNVRLVLAVEQIGIDGAKELAINHKVVLPRAAISTIFEQILTEMGPRTMWPLVYLSG